MHGLYGAPEETMERRRDQSAALHERTAGLGKTVSPRTTVSLSGFNDGVIRQLLDAEMSVLASNSPLKPPKQSCEFMFCTV